MSWSNNEPWTIQAACNTGHPEIHGLFFADDTSADCRKAISICRTCDVRSDCFDYALSTNQGGGVWAGFRTPERIKMRRMSNRRLKSYTAELDAVPVETDWLPTLFEKIEIEE